MTEIKSMNKSVNKFLAGSHCTIIVALNHQVTEGK